GKRKRAPPPLRGRVGVGGDTSAVLADPQPLPARGRGASPLPEPIQSKEILLQSCFRAASAPATAARISATENGLVMTSWAMALRPEARSRWWAKPVINKIVRSGK